MKKGFLQDRGWSCSLKNDRENKRRVTINDVAASAGVSISTASKALNDGGRMREETRLRIKQIAQAMGFRPNALAKGLLSKRSFTIGLLTNDTYGRFTLPVLAGVAEALVDFGVSVFLCAIEDNPVLGQMHLNALLDKQVDGIIATGRRVDRYLPVDLSDVPVPVVYALTEGDPGCVSFRSDDEQGARLAVDWLISMGRTCIAHITGPEAFLSVRERRDAFWNVVGSHAEVLHGEWSEAWGRQAIDRMFDGSAQSPDGLFCGNDQIARGAIDALRERGIRVPQDVSVVGFDNWDIVASQTRPPLTTVDMDLKELGRQAGLTVLALSEGREVERGLRKLPCRLVVRNSCGAAGTE